ncbi:hypothetical protein [Paraflavitalea pollutisoli]|uniref:hypothetical protein n=1 Tax=Paraflavitalea pollutisoli TaxID=3034143 RepID=UPI0023EC267B|nr:hypothetical protein [Paraflavitalea sp. H1-2-19X]
MKFYLTAFILQLGALASGAQSTTQTEFGLSENGLIYPDSTMRQLKHIVDSLNLRFKVCDLNKTYYAQPQGMAHYITLRDQQAWQARQDIDRQITFDQFQAKYTAATYSKDQLVIRETGFIRKDTITQFSSAGFGTESEYVELTGDPAKYATPLKGRWVYQFYDYQKGKALLKAYYFASNLHSPAVPTKYARQVLYVDCLIDTTSKLFTANDEGYYTGYAHLADSTPSKVYAFLQFVRSKLAAAPRLKNANDVLDKHVYAGYVKEVENWNTLKWELIRKSISRMPEFQPMLLQAYEEALRTRQSEDEFEKLVELFLSPKASLGLKRNRLVYGRCSMDQRPREHAVEIARLSAATVNWETFLRAHLDIMNDHFQSMATSSYGQAIRGTYIRELEVLDINVPDLMIGIALRVSNAAPNHYAGSVGRLGRALAETKEPAKMEAAMLGMIRDPTLDDFNRVLMYYVYLTYARYSTVNGGFYTKAARLTAAATTLPPYLAMKVKANPPKQ